MAPNVLIQFDKVDKVFHPGERVSGYISIISQKKIPCKCLNLMVLGFGHTFLQNPTTKERPNMQFKNEIYFTRKYRLYKNGPLPFGSHRFKFGFHLCDQVPSSFEGRYGLVKYSCEVTLVMLKESRNVHCLEDFTVVSYLNLNAEPLAKKPINLIKEKKGSWPCSTSTSISVGINRSGYVAGECIVVSALVLSSKHIAETTARMVQIVSYDLGNKTKFTEDVLRESKLRMHNGPLMNYVLRVPNVIAPSKLVGCRIMDLHYRFQYEVILKSHSKIVLEAPLLIGSIPLETDSVMSSTTCNVPIPSLLNPRGSMPSSPSMELLFDDDDDDEDDLGLPPSYEDCMKDDAKTQIKERNKLKKYV